MVGQSCVGKAALQRTTYYDYRGRLSCRVVSQLSLPVLIFILIVLGPSVTECLRLRGQWKPSAQFFHFLARFATEGKSRDLGIEPLEGNAFGNITVVYMGLPGSHARYRRNVALNDSLIADNSTNGTNGTNGTSGALFRQNVLNATMAPLIGYNTTISSMNTPPISTTTMASDPLASLNFRLLLVDQDHFLDVYTNRTQSHVYACQRMLSRLSRIAFDADCNLDGRFDLFRSVPCRPGKLCSEEDNPVSVVPGYQFRFRFRDAQPRMWYLALVACNRDSKSCAWRSAVVDDALGDVILEYDIWLVNGDPIHGRETSSALYFLARYQFSYEVRDLLLLRMAGMAAYSVLLSLTVLILLKATHVLCRLLIAAVILEAVGLFASTISTLQFGVDGEGAPGLIVFGDLLSSSGQSCLLLILMFLARGWTVSSRVLRRPGACVFLWLLYVLLNLASVGWLHASAVSLPVISSGTMAPEWTTSPGLSLIALRLLALGFFSLQLRETVLEEHSAVQLHFYHRFAASSLVWFVSWPVVLAVSSTFISPMDRQRTLVAFAIVADAVAISILLHIFRKSLNISPHKVPVINLIAPVIAASTSSRQSAPTSNTFIINFETIYFSVIGLTHSLYESCRDRFSNRVYSPLLSAGSTESLAMGDLSNKVAVNNAESLQRASAAVTPVSIPPASGTQQQQSGSSSPDWFEVELFSAGNNKNGDKKNVTSDVNGDGLASSTST